MDEDKNNDDIFDNDNAVEILEKEIEDKDEMIN